MHKKFDIFNHFAYITLICNQSTRDMEEIWKDIPGWDGFYEVSNKGNIRSWFDNNGPKQRGRADTPTLMSKTISSHGYEQANFKYNGRRKCIGVHRLVAKAFIPNPDNKPCVNHIDHDRINNHVDNLEWCTQQENISHAARHGRMCNGEKNGMSCLTKEQVLEIRDYYASGEYYRNELADRYDTTESNINRILSGDRWSHIEDGKQESIDMVAKERRKQKMRDSVCAKITQKDADEIRKTYKTTDKTQQMIADKYGIGQNQVSRIILGKAW